jgi:putative membrane protein
MTFNWSKKPFIIGLLYAALVQLLLVYFQIDFAIPWQPISIIGIAVAFYLGFKNNSSYDRTWEARKIWGGIVNSSRTFGAAVVAFVKGENQQLIQKELLYRHIAWLIALRYQLRLSRTWEHTKERLKGRFVSHVCDDYNNELNEQLRNYLSEAELDELEEATNTATQILRIQSKRLQALRDEGYFEDFRHMEFHQLIARFYNDQGAAERIKNFPFPRQYASTALWLTVVFSVFVPFGLVDVFKGYSQWLLWLSPLFSALITWVFFLMEKIGDYSENPFEGTYNDVPITSIARGIEIDLREMINDEHIPEAVQAENGFLL